MKKLLMIFAIVATGVAAAGCDVDADMGGVFTVDNISVAPGDWKISHFPDGQFNCMYVDKDIRELIPAVFSDSAYITYFKYVDEWDDVYVQKPLPLTVYNKEIDGFEWEYTLDAEYSERNLRITLRPQDFKPIEIFETMYFRLAIIR